MKRKLNMSRRAFLAATAGPMLLPSGAFGQPGRPGPNDRIITGHIGLGQRGRRLLRHFRRQAGALCDVDARQLKQAAADAIGPHAFLTADFRRLLDRPDLDAVLIATPPHWHETLAAMALDAGKDVYLEVPLSLGLRGGERLLRRAQDNAAILQSGGLASYTPALRALKAALQEAGPDALEEIKVRCENPPRYQKNDAAAQQPDTLDWDRWLGPAPACDWQPAFTAPNWRWRLDFGGGQILNQGLHLLSALLFLLEPPLQAQTTAQASALFPKNGPWDAPQQLLGGIELPGITPRLQWEQGHHPDDAYPVGVLLRHAEANWRFSRGDAQTATSLPVPQQAPLGDPLTAALEAWEEAIRTRSMPHTQLQQDARAGALALLLNLSARLQRTLTWDPALGAFLDDPQADRLRDPIARETWRL